MKVMIITCQPTNKRFKWELEVLATNLINLGVKPKDIVFLFLQASETGYDKYFHDTFGVETHTYQDDRDYAAYIPNIKPYLWSKYLGEDPVREQGTYLYIDSDVIFKSLPDLTKLPNLAKDHWYCSDTKGYTNYDYLMSCKESDKVVPKMCELSNITLDQLEKIKEGAGGAQWIIKDPTLAYWKKVYTDCNNYYKYYKEHPELTDLDPSNMGYIQSWASQMYAEEFNCAYFNITPECTDELLFAWTPDKHEVNRKAKIIHDSGAVEGDKAHIRKADYINTDPYSMDWYNIDRDSWSWDYVIAIIRAKEQLNR